MIDAFCIVLFILVHKNNIIMDEANPELRDKSFSSVEGISKRKIEKIMKDNIQNVEKMKNRLRVLSSHERHNSFCSKYQSQKIQWHQKIHQEAMERRLRAQSIIKNYDETQVKRERKEKIKSQIKQKLSEVVEKLKLQKIEVRKEIKNRSNRNMQLLMKRREKQLQTNRSMKMEVERQQINKRQTIARYNREKQEDIRTISALEKQSMLRYSQQIGQQLQRLSKRQLDLINLNSESVNSARALNKQYKDVYSRQSTLRIVQLPGIKRIKQKTGSTFD